MNCGVFVADMLGSVCAFSEIQTALLHRAKAGEGQYVDVSMIDAMLAMLIYEVQTAQFTPEKRRFLFTPCRTADGFVMIVPTSQRNFHDLCGAIGHPEWKANPRFNTQANRERQRSDLMALVEPLALAQTAAECEEHLLAPGEALTPSNAAEHRLMPIEAASTYWGA
jgi:CoA:oxalate CoA-transferase